MSAGDMAALEHSTLARLELESRTLEQPSELGLIARLRARDLTAFEELVAHFERPVYALCFRLLNDAEEARDAAQETFLKVYKGLSGFRAESGLKTWIYRIAINQAMNQQRWWRRRHRDETISLDISRGETDTTLGTSLPGKIRLARSSGHCKRARTTHHESARRDQAGISCRAHIARDRRAFLRGDR